MDTYPYFFRYVYKDADKKYKKHLDEYNMICRQKFRMNISELESLAEKTDEQKKLIDQFYHYCPLMISNSPMNLLCKYLESIDFKISRQTKADTKSTIYEHYKCSQTEYLEYYDLVVQEFKNYMKEQRQNLILAIPGSTSASDHEADSVNAFDTLCEYLHQRLAQIHSDPNVILNCLIDYFYMESPSANKDILWKAYGKYIYRNLLQEMETPHSVMFPFPTTAADYDLSYLGYHYKLQEVTL